MFSRLNMQFGHTEEQSLFLKGQHGATSKIMFIFILGSKSNGLVVQNVYKKLNDNSCLVIQSVLFLIHGVRCRWYSFLGLYDSAVSHLLEVLSCGHQSKTTQEFFLKIFLQTVEVCVCCFLPIDKNQIYYFMLCHWLRRTKGLLHCFTVSTLGRFVC